jgi:hypothetical protein
VTASRVAVIGAGAAGGELIRLTNSSDDLELAAVLVHSPDKVGIDAGILTGGDHVGVTARAVTDLGRVIADERIGLVFYAGLYDAARVLDAMTTSAECGVDVISVAGPMVFEQAFDQADVNRLRRTAQRTGSRITSTGTNPGFILDVLAVTVGSLNCRTDLVRASRVSEMKSWGNGVLEAFGIGRTVDRFPTEGHESLRQQAAIIGNGLGLDIDNYVERFEPYLAPTPRAHAGIKVARGAVGGFRLFCQGTARGAVVVELEWTAVFCLEDADAAVAGEPHLIVIEGDPGVECRLSGNVFDAGYRSLGARAINAVKPLRSAPPGLYGPHQLSPSA